MIKRLSGACVLAMILMPMSVMAHDKIVVAGYSGAGDDHYAYLGYIQAFGGELQDNGFRVRLVMEDVDYSYQPQHNAQHIDADASGGKAMLGYQWNLAADTSLSLWAGVQYRNAVLSRDDPSNDDADKQWDSTYLADFNHAFTPQVSLLLSASHSVRIDEYWSRIYPAYAFGNGTKFGPDISYMKGEDWSKDQYGLTLSDIRVGPVNLYISTGDEHDKRYSDDHAVYGRVGGSFSF